MKMKTNHSASVFLLSAFCLFFISSCQKDNNPAGSADTEMVASATADEQLLESTFNDVYDDATGIDDLTAGEEIGIYGSTGAGVFSRSMSDSSFRTTTRCFTVTVTPQEKGVFPKTVTLDFGTGCETRNHLRKGKISFTYSGRLHVPGSQVITNFENYSIDSFSIEGKHTLTNSATAGANQKSFSVKVENARITNTLSGKWWTWNSERHFKQTEGNGTALYPFDDVLRIEGGSNGSSSAGRNWVSEITNPLIKKFTCRWLVSGIIQVSVNNTVGTLDFGNGTCDNAANLAVNGASRTLTLR